MSDIPSDQVSLHLRFGVMTELGLYQDTLVFSEEEWAKRDDKAIEQSKQSLASTWVAFRSAQIEEEQALATKEGKLAKIAEIDTRITQLEEEKARLASDAATAVAAEAAPALKG